jgi:hypothetical protein
MFWRMSVPTFGYELYPWSDFASILVSFVSPVIATFVVLCLWSNAKLTKGRNYRFHQFLLTCLRDGEYDEAVRILMKNRGRLGSILTGDTAELIFDRKFVHELVAARTWIHLELLTNDGLLKVLGNCRGAVDRTVRELLATDESPLRTSALLNEGGDETLRCSDEDECLINKTFRNPQWYHSCRAGYPLVMAACEKIDSSNLDIPYNRADARYGARQGVASRANCPVFLAEKTIAHVLKESLDKGTASSEETHADAADLYSLFRAVYDHSRYRHETWAKTSGYGDYPTPFGSIVAEILRDYETICDEAWSSTAHGEEPPPEILGPVVRMWAFCLMYLIRDEDHVSPGFSFQQAGSYLDLTLRLRSAEVNTSVYRGSRAAWTEMFVSALKEASQSWGQKGKDFLTNTVNRMDICVEHIRKCHQWLRGELGLPPQPEPPR